jgi:hypothetical protein
MIARLRQARRDPIFPSSIRKQIDDGKARSGRPAGKPDGFGGTLPGRIPAVLTGISNI